VIAFALAPFASTVQIAYGSLPTTTASWLPSGDQARRSPVVPCPAAVPIDVNFVGFEPSGPIVQTSVETPVVRRKAIVESSGENTGLWSLGSLVSWVGDPVAPTPCISIPGSASLKNAASPP
jgi:hypothetical protein